MRSPLQPVPVLVIGSLVLCGACQDRTASVLERPPQSRDGEAGGLSPADAAAVRGVVRRLASPEEVYVLARTCDMYATLATEPGTTTYPYVQVFDGAFWECVERLATIPGRDTAAYLKDLSKGVSGADGLHFRELIQSQSALTSSRSSLR